MGARRELDVSGMTAFARYRHGAFKIREKKKKVAGAERVSKKTGLQEVRKVKRAKKFCRGWYEEYCVEDTYAEWSLQRCYV